MKGAKKIRRANIFNSNSQKEINLLIKEEKATPVAIEHDEEGDGEYTSKSDMEWKPKLRNKLDQDLKEVIILDQKEVLKEFPHLYLLQTLSFSPTKE